MASSCSINYFSIFFFHCAFSTIFHLTNISENYFLYGSNETRSKFLAVKTYLIDVIFYDDLLVHFQLLWNSYAFIYIAKNIKRDCLTSFLKQI